MNATVLNVQKPATGAKSVKVQFKTDGDKTVWAYAGLRDFTVDDFAVGDEKEIVIGSKQGSDGGSFSTVEKWGEKPQKRQFGGGGGFKGKTPQDVAGMLMCSIVNAAVSKATLSGKADTTQICQDVEALAEAAGKAMPNLVRACS